MIGIALLLLAVDPGTTTSAQPAQICKKIQRIGSLARPQKRCMSAEQWDEFTRTNKDYVASMQGQNWSAENEAARQGQLQNPMTNGSPF
ncbi:hypothetical protein V6R86_05325 [Sphingomonas kaistensis]|uniref:Uncharacterized protein n=1 Tax=Sphingomonas kaistensis TaxID=298708 RepID=A0ABZ2FZ66_9SPHN